MVRLDETPIIEAFLSAQNPLVKRQIPLPEEIRHHGGKLVFEMPEAVSPQALGMGADNRQLGVGLRQLSLVRAEKAVQGPAR